ncbi:MAG TPA: DUF1361 domain-containing protein [Candidatus Saccharimonadales bacterium]|nr:DUF1361 domain-containing protein [Candidatus Saccharimonadales bacterium]
MDWDWQKRFGLALGILTLADSLLLCFRIILTGTTRYSFIPWNLLLAWASLALAVILCRNLRHHRWLSWPNIALSLLWLIFLPNTWYVLTDFIHVVPNGEISQLYDIVMISLLVFVGFALGFAGLFLVHRELLNRIRALRSYIIIELIILFCGFAIYLGRDLRWNTWDVITNPGSVLVNVSDSVIDPFGNPRAFNVTALFFILISLLYLAFWIVTRPSKTSGD